MPPSPLFSPAARSVLHHHDDSFELEVNSAVLQQRERRAKASTQLRHDEEGNTTESVYNFSITVGMLEIYNEGRRL